MHPDNFTALLSNAERARFESLGKFQREFMPSYPNAIAGLILGLLAIAGGIYGIALPVRTIAESHGKLPFCVEGKQSWVSVGMLCLISLAFMGVGIGFAWWSISTLRRRVYFCEQGFWTARGEEIKIFKWDETPSIQQIMTKEQLPIHLIGFLLPAKPSRKIIVGQNNGSICSFSKNNIREFSVLEELIRHEAAQRDIPWGIID